MIRIVIVEDELLIRLGTKMSIDKHDMQLSVAETFACAEKALDYFDGHTADVLITDIRLTGNSGFELIKALKPLFPDMIYVVLSCYEDFSYARKAYELGVDKYILKQELREDELAATILQLYNAKHIFRGPEQKQFLPTAEVLKKDNTINLEWVYLFGYITMQNESGIGLASDNDLSYPIAAEIIQELLNRDNLGTCYQRNGTELFFLFNFSKTLSSVEQKTRIESFYSILRKSIKSYFNRSIILTVSVPFESLSSTNNHYLAVTEYAQYSFYLETTEIMWQHDFTPAGKCPELASDYYQILSDDKHSRFADTLKNFFDECQQTGVHPTLLKLEVVKFLHEMQNFLKNTYGLSFDDIYHGEVEPNYVGVEKFCKRKSLHDWLLRIIKITGDYLIQNAKKESTTTQITLYIQEHFHEDLTLSHIANNFHMNVTYLCQIYKKKTGTTIVQYINHIRIEKAKILLFTTKMSVEQIAEKVGIDNPNYFFRLFKKITGETVGQYRESLGIK